ncbi:apolipoprotein acyltransferase [Pelomonas sp. Root662]|nr:apolipoprotein acyltransferase [Pelomonas sp. Root405]KRA73460.1 apolipoprotein acyltransferase [Pelomonas sp. Root662]
MAALLCGLYVRGGPAWVLGFVALVPWLRTLDAQASLGRTLLSAWAMSVAYTGAVFYWFGSALGAYTQVGAGAGLALLLLAAPLFQPQILVFAVVRHLVRRHQGAALAAFAGAAAWVAAEWALPRLLGDTLGHGLYPARLLRQAADLGGATGLTVVLLLANEAVAAALARRRAGLRGVAAPLALATIGPLLLAGYGAVALQPEPPAATRPLRMGLVQSNITDYERLRRERGAEAVVREVLDTHFAMSYDAVERQRVDAVLWSETVYPTSFGQPKSEAGAELDAEIQATIDAAGVPFVFGTYDRDAEGEYNAAAFVQPGSGLVGMYRKTRLFPFTEYLPAWVDTPTVRGWLPGAGAWLPGSGARILPLRLADGREIPVLPLICLDDTDPGLAIAGARLGAQLILTMSNDAWFSEHAQGAALHQAVAAFRSIETRLPQFRVTTNGLSAVIAANGDVIAGTRMAERTLVIGELPVRDPAPTLIVRWGDWVGAAAAVFLAGLAVMVALSRRLGALPTTATATLPTRLVVLPPAARAVAGLLRLISRGGALAMGMAVLWGDGGLQTNTLGLLRMFAALCLIPEAAAWAVLRACTAHVTLTHGVLVLARGQRRLDIPLHNIAAVEPWRLLLPGAGASLRLATGERWPHGLALPDAWALARALGVPIHQRGAYARSRAQHRPNRLAKPALKFLLLPMLLAVPAFQLHQKIAYGSAFGEFYSFGLGAYLTAFGLWWAAWIAGVVLCAAAVRAVVEAVSFAAALARPQEALAWRTWLERLGLLTLYLGLPAWLLLRATAD